MFQTSKIENLKRIHQFDEKLYRLEVSEDQYASALRQQNVGLFIFIPTLLSGILLVGLDILPNNVFVTELIRALLSLAITYNLYQRIRYKVVSFSFGGTRFKIYPMRRRFELISVIFFDSVLILLLGYPTAIVYSLAQFIKN